MSEIQIESQNPLSRIFKTSKDGKLIEANDDVKFFKFTKDGSLETTEYKEVQKTDLLTELKN